MLLIYQPSRTQATSTVHFSASREQLMKLDGYVLRVYATPSGISLYNDLLLLFSSVLVLALQISSSFLGAGTSGKPHKVLKEHQTRVKGRSSQSHFHRHDPEQVIVSVVFSYHICKIRVFKDFSILLSMIFTSLMEPNTESSTAIYIKIFSHF